MAQNKLVLFSKKNSKLNQSPCLDDLIDDIGFEKLMPNNNHIEEIFNYCSECNIAMDTTNSGYECSKCGIKREIVGNVKDCNEDSTGILRTRKAGQSSFYNITPDYAKTQKKVIIDQLNKLNYMYKGPEIPKDILSSVATIYNDIQKIIVIKEEEDEKKITGNKKFVRRGNIKNEVIGALIKYECIRAGVPRKNKSICEFMKLACGISRGEDILRNLHLDGKIDIPINKDPGSTYTERYMETLGIDSKNYRNFVNNLVAMSIKKKIGMNSIMTSKIVGAIWILIIHEKINITSKQLETATENIRKNTWCRYSKVIEANLLKFIDVFNKWNVDHGIRGTLIKYKDLNKLITDGKIKNYKITTKY